MNSNEEIAVLGTLLDKLVRQIRLYGTEHSQTRLALDDLAAQLNEKLVEYSNLTFTLKRTALLFEDQPIFELTKSEGNYIQESFVDGIRAITFSSGLEKDELLRFCKVLGRDFQTYELQEEDTVTLLWKQDLEHIMYETVDVYASDRMALLQNLYSSLEDSEDDKEESTYLEGFVNKLIHPKPSAIGEAGPIGFSSTHHVETNRDINHAVPKDYFYWDEDIEKNFQLLTAKEMQRDIRPEVATVFSEILEVAEDEEFQSLCQNFSNRVRDYLLLGDIQSCNDWLRRLRAIQSYLGSTNPEIVEAVDRCLLESMDPGLLEEVSPTLVQEAKGKPEDWLVFFRYLGPKNLGFSGKLLEFFNQETIHSKVFELFKGFHYRYAFHYKGFLDSPNALLVRDGIRLLSPTLDDEAFKSEMSKLAIHPNLEIRKEILKALRGKSLELRFHFFKRAIEDASEEVRLLTYNELCNEPIGKLAKPLALKVSSEKFVETSLTEKKSALLALSKSGAPDAEHFILQIVETDEYSPDHRELRSAAISALVSFPSPKNQALLDQISNRKLVSKDIREVAKSTAQKISSQLTSRENETSHEI